MVEKTGQNGISQAAEDNKAADQVYTAAYVHYIAMMTDIDIPIDDSEVTGNSENQIAALPISKIAPTKSKKFEYVKEWYNQGAWNIAMCRNAIVKAWITSEEFKEITGKEYENNNGRSENGGEII